MGIIDKAQGHRGQPRSKAKQRRIRAIGALMAAAIVAGACGGALATPSSTGGATNTPWPTTSTSPTDSASQTPWPTDSAWSTSSPSPATTALPSPTARSSPVSTSAPVHYDIAMGKAAPLTPADDAGALVSGEINDFGFDMLRRLTSTGNLCASPTSIALTLAMVRPGARGSTATEMDKVLHNFGSTGQAAEIAALLQTLQGVTAYDDSNWYPADPSATPDHTGQVPVVELDISHAVFSQKGLNLEQAYLDSLSSEFGAGVGLLDYGKDPEAARAIINRWASDQTKGRIPEILAKGDVDSMTRLALANAVYLKGAWESPFDPADTRSLPFTRADGSKVLVPTMAMDHHFSYAAGTGYRAVELPIGDGSLSMTVVVPDDLSSFVKGLTAAKLTTIDSQLSTYDVDLALPRFSADSRFDLAEVLKAMGMPTAFDSRKADLSGITTDVPLYIQHVVHEANIDVVEEGVTASAVTVAVMQAGSSGVQPPHVKFQVDKPFLYFIRDGATGAVLFVGRIVDPSAKS